MPIAETNKLSLMTSGFFTSHNMSKN